MITDKEANNIFIKICRFGMDNCNVVELTGLSNYLASSPNIEKKIFKKFSDRLLVIATLKLIDKEEDSNE